MRCDFEKLYSYINQKLNENQKDEVVTHLHNCDICLEAVLLMCQDQSADSTGCPFKTETAGGLRHSPLPDERYRGFAARRPSF